MNDRAAAALQAYCLGCQFREADPLRLHQLAVAKQNDLVPDPGARALAVDVGEGGGGLLPLRRLRAGALEHRQRQRVLGELLHCGRGGQQLRFRHTRRRHHLDHVRLAQCQCAGLVEDNHRQLGRVLQRRGVLEENAVHRTEARTDHDRHRCGQPERVGAGDHEDGNGEREGEQQRLAEDPEPHREGRESDDDGYEHQPLRGLVGEQLARRLRVLRFLHQLDDLRERRVGTDLGGLVAEAAALVDGRADHRIADDLLHRHRLTGEHRLVDLRCAVDDLAVHRDLVARLDDHRLADQHLGGRHLGFDTVAQHGGHRRRQVHQRADRIGGAGAGAHLQPVAEQDEHQQHRRGLVEHLAFVEEGGAEAEHVAGADRQHDQRGHVRHLVARGAPAGDEERPAGIGDGAGGDDEQEQVAIHPERRREVAEHLAHRRVEEHRDREQQRDQEPVAHVVGHVLHRHAGRMAHVVHHVAHLMRGFAAVAGMRRVTRVRRGRWCLRCGAAHCRRRGGNVAGVPGVGAMAFVSRVLGMSLGRADVGGQHLAAAVVAALDDAPSDVLQRCLRLVVVHGGAAGDVVDVDVMNAGQRRDLALHAGGAQARDQFADFYGACLHEGSFGWDVSEPGVQPRGNWERTRTRCRGRDARACPSGRRSGAGRGCRASG